MLHIKDLTYEIDGRRLLHGASLMVPAGHRVGLVGRNGSGKTTLLRLLAGEIAPLDGTITMPRGTRVGRLIQEAPGDGRPLIDFVLAADTARARLLAEAESAREASRIADIQLALADIGAHRAPARAATILAGLGFDEAAQARPLAEYSGGWRMRVALAALLFAQPDLLLLDEPTNFLDLEGALWLEGYLKRYPRTVLIVSHDRELLNTAVQSIAHLEAEGLTLYGGGYDSFERQRRERQALQLKMRKKQDAARAHMQAYVDRFRYKASKARQAQSRLKALQRMEPVADLIAERVKPFRFPSPARGLAPPLVRLEGVEAGYAAGAPVLSGIDLSLDPDDRIGLLGANGNGKSTFAKLLAGRLAPLAGRMIHHNKLAVGYFAQHQLDELVPSRSPYQHLAALMPGASEAQRRAHLGSVGFGADTADVAAAQLSGGEKARLLFALASLAAPHLLILDEPTNHLDIDSRQALVEALNDYDGAVILISHDRHLIEASADRLWLVEGGTVAPFDGDIADYRDRLLAQHRGGGAAGEARSQAAKTGARQDAAARRRMAAGRRAALGPLKSALAAAEREVERLRGDLRAGEAALAAAGPRGTPAELAALGRRRAEAARALAAAEEAWLTAAEAYELAAAAEGGRA
jgi:ATP-binding cassette subfamily F protein 3